MGRETGNRAFNRIERWRPDFSRMSAIARAVILLAKGRYKEAFKIAHDNKGGIERADWHLDSPQELANILLQELLESLAIPMSLVSREDSVFKIEGDYWTIIYQGQIALLKATRGLHCLACLLRHPGHEFHVSELIAEQVDIPVLAGAEAARRGELGSEVATGQAQSCGPILDARAKSAYRRRIQLLREELEESDRFSDPERAARIQDEMNAIAKQLAGAVGLGGRDRQMGSQAERARSAVTKRIKKSINKIAEVIPPLGRHLAARIKTGYFCSYNPHPDRLVAWKF
jgi:hypothetical protein